MISPHFIRNFLKSNTAAGVEIEFLSDGSYRMNYALLKKQKDHLTLASHCLNISGAEELKTSLNRDVPLCLSLSGKGIISKKIMLAENDPENNLLHKALPNANPEEFYLQKISLENNYALLSVIRKSSLDALLSTLKEAGFFVVDVSFGPLSLAAITPWISPGREIVNICGHTLYIHNGELSDYRYEQKEETGIAEVSGERMDERLVPAFAAAFGYFASLEKNNPLAEIKHQREEYKHRRIFQWAGWAALIVFFSALFLNFMLFSHYNSLAEELSGKVFKSKDDLAGISSLQNELQQKQKFLDRMGLLESSRVSYYADQIASSVPETIQLEEMFIHPMEKIANAGKKELSFVAKTIRISGRCSQSGELNEWVKILKESQWVNAVNVLNYSQENANEPGVFQVMVSVR